MAETVYITDEQRDLILRTFGGVRSGPVAELEAENAALRGIISESAAAIGNGAAIGPKCSLEFMSWLPKEIAGVTNKLRSEKSEMIDALREAKLQIEYLHEKFKATGTGETTLHKIRSALSKATQTETGE